MSIALSHLAFVLAFSPAGFSGNLEPQNPAVAGGEEVEVCAWPSATAKLNGGAVACTSTLVHPRVMMLAAHCIDPQLGWGNPDSFGFGNDGYAPAGTVGVESCQMHPEWDINNLLGGTKDLAFCILSEDIDTVQIVPPLMGCELEALQEGEEVTIVGFGASYAQFGDFGWESLSGEGPKRIAQQTIEKLEGIELFLLGQEAGGCPGDSGGPAMIQLADGSWRCVGAASRIHPDSPNNPGENACGYGTTYAIVGLEMEWFESASGYDVTPCHDADGTWNPTELCDAFPLSPGVAVGTWEDLCRSEDLSGPGASCGEPFGGGEGDGETGDETGGGTDETGSGEGSGEIGSADAEDSSETSGELGTGESGEDSGALDGSKAGCGCRTQSGSPPIFGGLALFGVWAWRGKSKRQDSHLERRRVLHPVQHLGG